MKSPTPVVVDLFSGAGGLSLGFLQAGLVPVLAIDKWKLAWKTYSYNIKTAKALNIDIQKVDANLILNMVGQPDVVIGGPPCQGFSYANTRRNANDRRNALSWKFIDLVTELKPKVFVLENVVGMLSLKINGEERVIDAIYRRVKQAGYHVVLWVLKADRHGLPQKRKRMFLIGIRNKSLNLSEPEESNEHITVADALSDLAKAEAAPANKVDTNEYRIKIPVRPLSEYQRKLRDADIVYNHVYHVPHEDSIRRMAYIPPGKSLRQIYEELPEDLRISSVSTVHSNIYRRLSWDSPAPTIVHIRKAMLIHPQYDRLLTVREATRLQGFPDSFRFFGSINQQYQLIADATPPPLAYRVAQIVKRILERLD